MKTGCGSMDRLIFQNWYGGEDYDACLAEELIGKIPSEENGWAKAKKMQSPKGVLMARECPPIRIEERFTAKSVKKLGEGHFHGRCGKKWTWFCGACATWTTKENRGNWISMYPAEMINETDNGVDQRSCTQELE